MKCYPNFSDGHPEVDQLHRRTHLARDFRGLRGAPKNAKRKNVNDESSSAQNYQRVTPPLGAPVFVCSIHCSLPVLASSLVPCRCTCTSVKELKLLALLVKESSRRDTSSREFVSTRQACIAMNDCEYPCCPRAVFKGFRAAFRCSGATVFLT